MTSERRKKARGLALAIITVTAFLGTCSGIFGNFEQRGADYGVTRPIPD